MKYENEIVRHRIKHIDDAVNELITNASTISNSGIGRNCIDPYIETEIYDIIHRSLSKEHEKIFLKYFFEDIPIAKLENVNQSTISRYLRESINKLKKEFFKKF